MTSYDKWEEESIKKKFLGKIWLVLHLPDMSSPLYAQGFEELCLKVLDSNLQLFVILPWFKIRRWNQTQLKLQD